MRIGLIARADKTGLGIQTNEFFKHMKPDKVMVVDLHHCSNQHPDLSLYPDCNLTLWHDRRYPGTEIVHDPVVDEFLRDLDIVFTCETPYNYYLYVKAKEMGVKTVQQFNYEFLDYLYLNNLPYPDMLASPSLWHFNDVKQKFQYYTRVEHLPVPVNRNLLPFRKRDRLTSILHTAGTPAVEDRNGTNIAISAMAHVKSPVTLHLKSQKQIDTLGLHNVSVDYSHFRDYHDLYGDQDAYMMPRKFGGLSLPINEAISAGMVFIGSKTSPQTEWLPNECLVDGHVSKQIMTKTMIDIFETDIMALANKIDELYEDSDLFSSLSNKMNELAEEISWENMRPKYLELFGSLL